MAPDGAVHTMFLRLFLTSLAGAGETVARRFLHTRPGCEERGGGIRSPSPGRRAFRKPDRSDRHLWEASAKERRESEVAPRRLLKNIESFCDCAPVKHERFFPSARCRTGTRWCVIRTDPMTPYETTLGVCDR